jgi:hypothetical protein
MLAAGSVSVSELARLSRWRRESASASASRLGQEWEPELASLAVWPPASPSGWEWAATPLESLSARHSRAGRRSASEKQ